MLNFTPVNKAVSVCILGKLHIYIRQGMIATYIGMHYGVRNNEPFIAEICEYSPIPSGESGTGILRSKQILETALLRLATAAKWISVSETSYILDLKTIAFSLCESYDGMLLYFGTRPAEDRGPVWSRIKNTNIRDLSDADEILQSMCDAYKGLIDA